MNTPPSVTSLTVAIEDVAFHAFHGVFEQERAVGAEFRLTLSVEIPFNHALEDDNLDATINYAALFEICKSEMNKPSRLIENVALRIASKTREIFPRILRGHIKIVKMNPPIRAFDGSASVEFDF